MKITSCDIKDIALEIVDQLVLAGILKDCMDTEDSTEFDAQDIIREVLCNKFNAVTADEITSLDSRIKSCEIENPEESDDEFYVKIWFNYKIGNDDLKPDGRQEFVTETKEQLISEIQDFMKSDKNGWCIL